LIGDVISRRYAKALISSIGERDGYEGVGRELKEVSETIDRERRLKEILNHPGISIQFKRQILDLLLQRLSISKITANFLRLLLEKHRLNKLPVIIEIFEQMAMEALGKAKALVKTPFPLKEEEEEYLRLKLEEHTGKKIILESEIDPDLIGGIYIRIGSTIYDGTIKSQLTTLKERLMSRGGA